MPVRADDLETYLNHVVGLVNQVLGESLVGLYLHGSAVLGSFAPGKSDIDLLAVLGETPDPPRLGQLGEALHPDVIAHPSPLDLHVVTQETLRSHEPRWEAWFSSHPAWGEFRVVLDPTEDRDLFLAFHICRRQGRALVGPPPEELFPEVPLRHLLQAADANLTFWQALDHFWLPEEAVLTACRAWYLVERGVVAGKREAGEWAKDRWEGSTVIADALARWQGAEVIVSQEEARRLIQAVRDRLQERAETLGEADPSGP